MRAFQRTGTENLVYLRDLLRELVARDLRIRYKRSVAGIGWSLLNPFLQLIVLNLVFSKLLPLNIPNYVIFLFVGLLAWNWFQSSLYAATSVIVDHRDLIKRPGFPAAILPVVTLMSNFIHFLLALPILFLFVLLVNIPLNPALIILPLLYMLQFLFTLSLSYFFAALHVTFRDMQYLVGVALFLGFYLTPVFYDPSMLPAVWQKIYFLNPMAVLIDTYRSIILEGRLEHILSLCLLFVITMIALVLGYRFFLHASYRFAEEL